MFIQKRSKREPEYEFTGKEAHLAELSGAYARAERTDRAAAEVVAHAKRVLKESEATKAQTSASFSKAKRDFKTFLGE